MVWWFKMVTGTRTWLSSPLSAFPSLFVPLWFSLRVVLAYCVLFGCFCHVGNEFREIHRGFFPHLASSFCKVFMSSDYLLFAVTVQCKVMFWFISWSQYTKCLKINKHCNFLILGLLVGFRNVKASACACIQWALTSVLNPSVQFYVYFCWERSGELFTMFQGCNAFMLQE